MKTKNEKVLSSKEIILSEEIAHRLRQLRLSFPTPDNKPLSMDRMSEMIETKYAADGFKLSKSSILNYEIDDYEYNPKFGKNLGMSAQVIYYLSDFFGVSADYITGKSKERTPDKSLEGAAIVTGLSPRAIDSLQNIPGICSDEEELFSSFISNEKFFDFYSGLVGISDALKQVKDSISKANDKEYNPGLKYSHNLLKFQIYETCEACRDILKSMFNIDEVEANLKENEAY